MIETLQGWCSDWRRRVRNFAQPLLFRLGFAKFLLIGCASLRRSHAMWLMSNFEAAAFVVIVALMVAMAVIVSREPLGRRAAQNANHWRAITSLGAVFR